jgi:diaminopimelate epimerase
MKPETLQFTKMQGVGNDFVLIDGREYRGMDWPGLAIEICDRRFGVGSDGLLVIDHSNIADAAMRMYNPDGTPDFCGNGIRCVARYLAEESLGVGPRADPPITQSYNHAITHTLNIATLAGVRRTATADPGTDHCSVTVDMGKPRFEPSDIPMLVHAGPVKDYPLEVDGKTVRITSLSTGTAHTILFVGQLPKDEEFLQISPLIEHHPLFPERTSVLWTHVKNSERIDLRIWERGAGETWGCGTGACAAAVAAQLHGYAIHPVAVHSKGGILLIEWESGGSINMTGPAEYVYTGAYPISS